MNMMPSKTLLSALIASTALAATPAMAQNFARSYGSPEEGVTTIASNVRNASGGGLLVTGFDLDGTQQIGTAMKLDAAGNVDWRRAYRQGADNTNVTNSTPLPNDETVLVGIHRDLPWVMKVDRVGVPIWQVTTATRLGGFMDVLHASDGSIYAAGYTQNRFDESMFALAKLDLNGNLEWQFGYGGNLWRDLATTVAEAHDGGILIAGRFEDSSKIMVVKVDTDGRRQWAEVITPPVSSTFAASPRIVVADNGDILLSAGRSYTNSNDDDMWAIRMDSNGQVLWNKRFNRGIDSSSAIALLPGGDVILAGTSEVGGNKDFLVVRLNADGHFVWRKTYGGNGIDVLNGACVRPDGGVALVGYTESFEGTFWVVSFDENGEVVPGFPYEQDAAVAYLNTSNPSESTQLGSDYPPSRSTTAVTTIFKSADQSIQASENALQWTDLGEGLAGTEGQPYLGGAGNLRARTPVGMVMSSMRQYSLVTVMIGTERIDAPAFGGTLVPAPGLILSLSSGSEGYAVLESEWPDFVPPGFSLYIQAIVADFNAPGGFAFTNAIRGVAP